MGTTIHYQLSLKGNRKKLLGCLAYLAKTATEMGFAYVSPASWFFQYEQEESVDDTVAAEDLERYQEAKIWCSPFNDLRSKLVAAKAGIMDEWIRSGKRSQGYARYIQWREGCEPIILGMIRSTPKSRLWGSMLHTKTQWGPNIVDAHESVCRLLRVCEQAGILAAIYDETGYWQDEDITSMVDDQICGLRTVKDVGWELYRLLEPGRVTGPGLRAAAILKDVPDLDF